MRVNGVVAVASLIPSWIVRLYRPGAIARPDADAVSTCCRCHPREGPGLPGMRTHCVSEVGGLPGFGRIDTDLDRRHGPRARPRPAPDSMRPTSQHPRAER